MVDIHIRTLGREYTISVKFNVHFLMQYFNHTICEKYCNIYLNGYGVTQNADTGV